MKAQWLALSRALVKVSPFPSCLQACSLGKGEVWGNGVEPVTEAGCLGAGCDLGQLLSLTESKERLGVRCLGALLE